MGKEDLLKKFKVTSRSPDRDCLACWSISSNCGPVRTRPAMAESGSPQQALQELNDICRRMKHLHAAMTKMTGCLEGLSSRDTGYEGSQDTQGNQADELQRLLADAITFKLSLEDISFIIDCGARVNKPVKKGLYPIHYAAYENYTACIELLIERGASVNAKDEIGYSPLHVCARQGHVRSMEMLLQHGAQVNMVGGEAGADEDQALLGYMTFEPLNMALDRNHVECVKCLLDHGANPNNLYFLGYEINLVPLENEEALRELLKHKADIELFDKAGLNIMMKACKEDKSNIVEMLVEFGVNLEAVQEERFGWHSPMHIAIKHNSLSCIRKLLALKTSLNKPAASPCTYVTFAAIHKRQSALYVLLENGADVNEKNKNGTSAVQMACRDLADDNTPSVILHTLIEAGADVNFSLDSFTYDHPCLSPLCEYLSECEKADTTLIWKFLDFGARVAIQSSNRGTQILTPFGISRWLYKISGEGLDLVLQAAENVDTIAVQLDRNLSEHTKEDIVDRLSSAPTLKHASRLAIRKRLPKPFSNHVRSLDIPSTLHLYLQLK